mgnify:FL=1
MAAAEQGGAGVVPTAALERLPRAAAGRALCGCLRSPLCGAGWSILEYDVICINILLCILERVIYYYIIIIFYAYY